MTNEFAYIPEDKRPMRLIRWEKHTGGKLASYDPDKNIVFIDKGYYDALDELDQGRVLATHEDLYVKERGGRLSIR